MKKLLSTLICMICVSFASVTGQVSDTIVTVDMNKQLLFSNAKMWSIQTKPYIEKNIVISDSDIGKVVIETNIRVNKDDISFMEYIGYSLECNTVIDVKDGAYKVLLESPSVLININPSMSLNRMSTKQLLKYKDELELIEELVVEDRLLNDIIHWSIEDVYVKEFMLKEELNNLEGANKPSKKKISKLNFKLDVIEEILTIWDNYSRDIISSIIDGMGKDNSF